MKKCRSCKQEKPLEDFRVDPRKKDGHYATCRGCLISAADARRLTRPPVTSKQCKTCQLERSADEFGIDRSTRDGLRASCKGCRIQEGHDYFAGLPEEEKKKRLERTAQWRRNNPEAYRAACIKSSRKQKYGIDEPTYREMLEQQGHRCAICGREETARTNGRDVDHLSVDHDHATGAIRELLCSGCNKGLGCFRENPAILEAAAEYLRRHGKI